MSIMDLVSQHLGDGQVEQIAGRLGASKEQTQSAIGMALPTLLGAVAKKAENDDGVAEIDGQLGEHDGSIFDSLSSLLGGGDEQQASQGNQLLGSILGGRQGKVETGIGKASGLQGGQVSSLMGMLAPMVMGAIGKKKRDDGMDRGGLGGMLKGERQQIEQQASGGLLAGLLDQDGDGDFDFSDVMQIGMKRFFG
ncbi:MAG: DUF937 domain-containing protein [Planctomycetota bacterium]